MLSRSFAPATPAVFADRMRSNFEDIFRTFESHLTPLLTSSGGTALTFPGSQQGIRVDLFETDDEYQLTADVPGYGKKDIKLDVSDDILTITAQKEASKEEDKGEWHFRERTAMNASRSMRLPDSVNVDAIKASFPKSDGVLRVTLPKKPVEERKKTKSIKIN